MNENRRQALESLAVGVDDIKQKIRTSPVWGTYNTFQCTGPGVVLVFSNDPEVVAAVEAAMKALSARSTKA